MNTTRRGFLAALAALPVVGRLFPKPEIPAQNVGPWPPVTSDVEGPITIRYYYYDARTGEQSEILPMTATELAKFQHRQYECERLGRRYRVRQA